MTVLRVSLIITLFVILSAILSVPLLSAAAPEDIDYSGDTSDVTYSWGLDQEITISIPDNTLSSYQNSLVPRFGHLYKAYRYTTPDDPIILAVAAVFSERIADMSAYQKAAYVLRFVQECIEYKSDTAEYWQYPVETLARGTGDCEDQSFLYASIMAALGFDVVYIQYQGHVQVGIDLGGFGERTVIHDGIEYSLCEPTAARLIGYDNGREIIAVVDPDSHVFMAAYATFIVLIIAGFAWLIFRR